MAIDSFELSVFDQASADILTTRLKALIGGEIGEMGAGAWPGGDVSSVAFQVSWRGTLGGKRGAKGEMAIGPTWFAVGQATLDAESLHFLQPDFHDPHTLHLGFTHRKKSHTIAVCFPGGPEAKENRQRAHALLARLRALGAQASAGYGGGGMPRTGSYPALSGMGGNGGDGSVHGGSVHGGASGGVHVGSVHASLAWLQEGHREETRKLSCAKLCTQLEKLTAYVVSIFELQPVEAARGGWIGRCGTRFSVLLLVTLVLLGATAVLTVHSSRKWATYTTPFHPASCTVLSLELISEMREASHQECSHNVRHCSKLFYVVRAAWKVQVRLLGRYLDPTQNDNDPSLGDHPPPREAFDAVAQPTLHQSHLLATPSIVSEGVCAGNIGWSRDATLRWCDTDELKNKWLPMLDTSATYLCSADSHKTTTVFFDVSPPWRLYIESCLLSLSAVLSLALLAVVFVVAWHRCAPRHIRRHSPEEDEEYGGPGPYGAVPAGAFGPGSSRGLDLM